MKQTGFSRWIPGFLAGLLNGIFGAGGGVAIVPLLEAQKLSPQKAHATSVAIILPLSAASALSFWLQGILPDWRLLLWLVPGGLVGAVLGAKWLPQIKGVWLKRSFGVLLVYSGIRLLFF